MDHRARDQLMRLIAGEWRGRTIEAPKSQDTRPTSDRAREGLFSMLVSRIGSFEGLQVADLFSGTGALGLEALSRGAASCTFIERDRSALDLLARNIAKLRAQDRAKVLAQSVEHARPPDTPFDLVLMDPPYGTGLAQAALDRVASGGWLVPGAWIATEISGEQISCPTGLELEVERAFGKATMILIRKPGQALS